MSFEILMGTFVVGIAVMLGIIGNRQWQMGYRIAGGLSLGVAAAMVIGAMMAAFALM